MKLKNILPLSTYFLLSALSILSLSLHAAVPQRWTVETSRLQPVVFDAVRGETLALEASFQSYGTPVETSNMTAFVCWQTNGMGSAWWVTNAVTTATVARVLFTPEMDPGAPVVNAFIGLSDATNSPLITSHSSLITSISSLSYRAAFTLRFRHGPGSTPNALPLPTPTIDCAQVTFLHPEYAPFSGGGGATDLSPSTNYTDTCISTLSNYTDTCCIALAVSSTNYTDAATNDATLVRYDINGDSGAKLTYGGTPVTFEDVGALSKAWKDNEESNFEGVARYANDADTAYRSRTLNAGPDLGGEEMYVYYDDETSHRWRFYNEGHPETFAFTSELPTTNDAAFVAAFAPKTATAESIANLSTTSATHTASIATLTSSIDYTTNNSTLVSTITNLAPSKARGISLHDPVRHCNWYQAVTNGVFYWLVEE